MRLRQIPKGSYRVLLALIHRLGAAGDAAGFPAVNLVTAVLTRRYVRGPALVCARGVGWVTVPTDTDARMAL